MKMEEWKECKFKDLYKIPSKNGLSKPSRVRGSGYKMINMGELFSNDRIYNIPMELVPLTDTEKENAKVEVNDLLFARQSLIVEGAGKCSIVMETNELTVFESHIIRVRLNQELAYPPFFYYYFKNKNSPIRTIIQHCVQAGIKASDLAEITVKLPPLSTQQKIAAILSSLDDKIELNNKINTNLEHQAQALFKNWFVDFEPFGGKMPEGWKVGKLCDIADYSSEKIEINKLSSETYYSTENMLPSKGGIETATSLPSISQTTRCLPGETIISNIRPYFKKIFYCTEEVAGCSTDVLCFKPKYKDYSEYLYQVLYSDIFFDYMVLGSKGTKMPRGDKQQIMNYTITIPDELYLHKYKTFAKPILSQIDTNRKENKRLSEIRDTLLPKLMNGEIRQY